MLALPLALALMQTSPVPELERGSRLYKECLAGIRVQDGTATGPDSLLSNTCFGYIDGFTDGLQMAGSHAICMNSATFGTIARVYVAYMASHPKMMDVEKAAGLTEALLESYACPATKK